MEKLYKGFVIRQVGMSFKHCKDFEVHPVGKPEEVELWEDITIEDIENQIDCLVN